MDSNFITNNSEVPNVSVSDLSMNFFQRFVEAHQVMFGANAALKPKEGEKTSRPWMWYIQLKQSGIF